MKKSLIALMLCAMTAAAVAYQLPPDVAVASMKSDALASGVTVKGFQPSGARPCGSPPPAKASRSGGLARDSP